jgi:hypothetical protein
MQEGKGEQQGGSNLSVNHSQFRFQAAPLRLGINILICHPFFGNQAFYRRFDGRIARLEEQDLWTYRRRQDERSL